MNRKIVGSMMKLTAFLFLSFSSYHVFFFSNTITMTVIFGIISLFSTFFVIHRILDLIAVVGIGLLDQLNQTRRNKGD